MKTNPVVLQARTLLHIPKTDAQGVYHGDETHIVEEGRIVATMSECSNFSNAAIRERATLMAAAGPMKSALVNVYNRAKFHFVSDRLGRRSPEARVLITADEYDMIRTALLGSE